MRKGVRHIFATAAQCNISGTFGAVFSNPSYFKHLIQAGRKKKLRQNSVNN